MVKQTCNVVQHIQQAIRNSYHDGCAAAGYIKNLASRLRSSKGQKRLIRPGIHATLRNGYGIKWVKLMESMTKLISIHRHLAKLRLY